MSDEDASLSQNYTLPDGVWKDSFDKLLEPRPMLRELKLLKKEVRASFNMDSSFENNSEDSSKLVLPDTSMIMIEKINSPRNCKSNAVISTPLQSKVVLNPFACPLSPIGEWEFQYFEKQKYDRKTISTFPDTYKTRCLEEKMKDHSSDKIPSNSQNERKTRQVPTVFIEPTYVDNEQGYHKESPKRSTQKRLDRLTLQTGKWRKSLSVWLNKQPGLDQEVSTRSKFVAKKKLSCYRKSIIIENEDAALSNVNNIDDYGIHVLKRCQQRKPIAFEKLYPMNTLKECRKIGEGTFGEVFLNKQGNDVTVLKVIPIEGKFDVNGEAQKTYEQLLPEIVTTMELSNLNLNNKTFSTSGFIGCKKISCVKGKYPKYLCKMWDDYDCASGSENDNPKIFPDTQLYIVLELCYGGQDLETYVFSNAEQSFYALQQIIFTLAVAEKTFSFEHRDLHWGNILLCATTKRYINYTFNGQILTVASKGVKATIIDYTLSRISIDNYCFYNDLSKDEDLFTAAGDYQFDMYRMMRNILKNNWQTFEPKTNVFWISYIVSKMIDGVSYKSPHTKTHKLYMKKLSDFKQVVLNFNNLTECMKHFQKL